VPKQSKTMKDFSGGIAKGIDSSSLLDNQLQECENFIADGLGKMTVIPNEGIATANELQTELPDGFKKNIHAWSADMNLASNIQDTTNIQDPTTEEIREPVRATLELYFSPFQSSLASPDTDPRWLVIKDSDRDEYIIQTGVPNYNIQSSSLAIFTAQSPKACIQGLTLNALEQMTDRHYEDYRDVNSSDYWEDYIHYSDYKSPSIPWHFKTIDNSDVRPSGDAVIPVSFEPIGDNGFETDSTEAYQTSRDFVPDPGERFPAISNFWINGPSRSFEGTGNVYEDNSGSHNANSRDIYLMVPSPNPNDNGFTKEYPNKQRNGGNFKIGKVSNGGSSSAGNNTLEFGFQPESNDVEVKDEYMYKMVMEWDYWGEMNINFPNEAPDGYENYCHQHGYFPLNVGTQLAQFGQPHLNIDGTDFTYYQLADLSTQHGLERHPIWKGGLGADGKNYTGQAPVKRSGSFYFIKPVTKSYGQFSKWKWSLYNIKSNETALYSVTITYYTDPEQTTEASIVKEFQTMLGNTASEIKTGLFYESDNIITGTGDHQIKFDVFEDSVELYQDTDTLKAYGIKSVVPAKTNIQMHENVSSGQRYQHLVSIANEDSMATVYSMENDVWLEYQIDLKFIESDFTVGQFNSGVTEIPITSSTILAPVGDNVLAGKQIRGYGIEPGTKVVSNTDSTVTIDTPTTQNNESNSNKYYYWSNDQNVDLSFVDAEGYLFISDSTFHNNNKPQWFGFLDLNHTYMNEQFDSESNNYNGNNPQVEMAVGFHTDDLCPSPYRVDQSSGLLEDKNTHRVHENEHLFEYLDGTEDESIVADSVNIIGTKITHPLGVNVQYCWIDGRSGTGERLDGSFTKKELTEFYFSYKYDGGFTSQPQPFYDDDGNSFASAPTEDASALGISIQMGNQIVSGKGDNDSWSGLSSKDTVLNTRLKGIEIYARFTYTDANNLYLVAEIDLNKGWKSFATGTWKPFTVRNSSSGTVYSTTGSSNGGYVNISDVIIYKSMPTFQSFFNKYELDWDAPIGFTKVGTGWKTACVFNRRAYFGNVRIEGKDGLLHNYPDGILKSSLGNWSTVGESNLIEATINDGDDIIALRVAGNKLCQFKRYSLTIMGVKTLENGQNREEIEQVIHHVGLENDNQICDTPYGLFWVSRSGMYLFDGKQLTKLTENKQGSTISKKSWENFYGQRTHVGYDAYWNQVHICKDTVNNNKSLIYSFNTRAFTETNEMYGGNKKTGFVTDREGHLMWCEQVDVGTRGSSYSPNQNRKKTKMAEQTATAMPPNDAVT